MSGLPEYVPYQTPVEPPRLHAGAKIGLPAAADAAICGDCDLVFDWRLGRCGCGSEQFIPLETILAGRAQRNARESVLLRRLRAAVVGDAHRAELLALVRQLEEIG